MKRKLLSLAAEVQLLRPRRGGWKRRCAGCTKQMQSYWIGCTYCPRDNFDNKSSGKQNNMTMSDQTQPIVPGTGLHNHREGSADVTSLRRQSSLVTATSGEGGYGVAPEPSNATSQEEEELRELAKSTESLYVSDDAGAEGSTGKRPEGTTTMLDDPEGKKVHEGEESDSIYKEASALEDVVDENGDLIIRPRRKRKRKKRQRSPKGTGPATSEGASAEAGDLRSPAQEAKRSKQEASSFSKAAERALRVCMVYRDDDQRMLGREECDFLREVIVAKITDGTFDGDFSPQFSQSGLFEGTLLMTCANEQTKQWLLSEAKEVKRDSDGAIFKAALYSEVRALRKVTVRVSTKKDLKYILGLLAKQNRGLDTSRWFVYHNGEGDDYRYLVLGVDRLSYERLKALDFRPYFELGRLNFLEPKP